MDETYFNEASLAIYHYVPNYSQSFRDSIASSLVANAASSYPSDQRKYRVQINYNTLKETIPEFALEILTELYQRINRPEDLEGLDTSTDPM